MAPETIIIIDASYWAHASHQAMPMLKRSDGHHIGGVFGYARTLLRFLAKPCTEFSHIVACLDAPGPTWRHRVMPDYKIARAARREAMKGKNGALFSQWPMVREVTEVLGIKTARIEGVEADDLIATYTRLARARGMDVVIVTVDKDLCQLIRPGVRVFDPHPNRRASPWLDGGTVFDEFGVLPEQIPDYLALVGDTADSIPGVPGVGPIKAAELLRAHGNVADIVRNARTSKLEGSFASKLLVHSLVAYADQIEKAKTVATTHDRIDLDDDDLDRLFWRGPDFDRAYAFMRANEFDSLYRQIEGIWPETIRETDDMNTFKNDHKEGSAKADPDIKQNPGHKEGAVASTPTQQPLMEPQVPRREEGVAETRDAFGNVIEGNDRKNPDGSVGSGPNKERPAEEKIEDQPHKLGTRPGEPMTKAQQRAEEKAERDDK